MRFNDTAQTTAVCDCHVTSLEALLRPVIAHFRFVYDLDIPLVGGRVPFHKTIYELVKRVSQSSIPAGELSARVLICMSLLVCAHELQTDWNADLQELQLDDLSNPQLHSAQPDTRHPLFTHTQP
jgi:hypothetical protein